MLAAGHARDSLARLSRTDLCVREGREIKGECASGHYDLPEEVGQNAAGARWFRRLGCPPDAGCGGKHCNPSAGQGEDAPAGHGPTDA